MPRIQQNVQDVDGGAGTLVTTTELVVATLPGLVTDRPDAKVVLEGAVSLTTGTGVTAIQLRVRRGTTIAGALVGALGTVQVGASLPSGGSIQVDDSPGEVAGQQYVLTAQQVGATGNGSVQAANLQATY